MATRFTLLGIHGIEESKQSKMGDSNGTKRNKGWTKREVTTHGVYAGRATQE